MPPSQPGQISIFMVYLAARQYDSVVNAASANVGVAASGIWDG